MILLVRLPFPDLLFVGILTYLDSFNPSAYANPGEICLGIVVASAPTWRPIYLRVINNTARHSSSAKKSFLHTSKTDSANDKQNIHEKNHASHPVVPTWASQELTVQIDGMENEGGHTKRWKFHD
jgi:hypothetical protein